MSDILDFLAEKLARLIGTPSSSAKGLLRLAIRDRFPDKQEDPTGISISEYKSVLETSVKARLLRAHYLNVDTVIDEISKILDDMGSIITMTRV